MQKHQIILKLPTKVILFSFWLSISQFGLASVEVAEVTQLPKLIELSLSNSASVAARGEGVQVAAKKIEVEKTALMPKFMVGGIDTIGLPGSGSLSDFGGFMGSPFREGWSVGLFAAETVYDFGKTSSRVEAAEKNKELSIQQRQVEQMKVSGQVLELYLACAAASSKLDLYRLISLEANSIQKEVRNFVRTGQRSVVEDYLITAQATDFLQKKEDAKVALEFSKKQLGQYADLAPEKVGCENLENLDWLTAQKVPSSEESPYIKFATSRLKLAQAELQNRHTQERPWIEITGSAGDMENVRLVPNDSWAAAVGFVIPIWDGGKTDHQEAEALQAVAEGEKDLAAAQQRLDAERLALDRLYERNKVRVGYLGAENKAAKDALHLAKERYQSYSGGLIDLRESDRNAQYMGEQWIDAKEQWVSSSGTRVLLFGGKIQ